MGGGWGEWRGGGKRGRAGGAFGFAVCVEVFSGSVDGREGEWWWWRRGGRRGGRDGGVGYHAGGGHIADARDGGREGRESDGREW